MVDQTPTPQSLSDERLQTRIKRHLLLERELDALRKEELLSWLSSPTLAESGRAIVSLGEAKVFVKLLPLTELERRPEHQRATANLFGLPSYYQYRLGSRGFGAWRELAAQELSNSWVLSGHCPHFPLLHAWRELPLVSKHTGAAEHRATWGNDAAVEARNMAVEAATSSLVLFQEYVPLTLSQWLGDQLSQEIDHARLVSKTETTLLEILAFLASKGVLHMDAHFENVLTDGTQLFLGDFGLALSQTFQLDEDEQQFFERHQNFDYCTAITGMVHALVSHKDTRRDWRAALGEFLDGTDERIRELPAATRTYLARRGPLAIALGKFYGELIADLETPYPASDLQELLEAE